MFVPNNRFLFSLHSRFFCHHCWRRLSNHRRLDDDTRLQDSRRRSTPVVGLFEHLLQFLQRLQRFRGFLEIVRRALDFVVIVRGVRVVRRGRETTGKGGSCSEASEEGRQEHARTVSRHGAARKNERGRQPTLGPLLSQRYSAKSFETRAGPNSLQASPRLILLV